ncbi:MAG: hypothetical protein Kow0099_27960 [Candidatus Abyssubacteria bacterium]
MASALYWEVEEYCRHYSKGLAALTGPGDCIEFIRGELPTLMGNRGLLEGLLDSVLKGTGYPDLRGSTMFDNELLLFADEQRLFSLRMFLWAPGEFTPIHDHSAWGVIGPAIGEMDVINYRPEIPPNADCARLVETERLRLKPGETTHTLPLNDGIHKIGNPLEQAMLSLSLYGNPLPRGYIRGFELESGRVYHIFSPRTKKRRLAAQVLNQIRQTDGSKG